MSLTTMQPSRVMDAGQVREVITLRQSGASIKTLAQRFGRSQEAIRQLLIKANERQLPSAKTNHEVDGQRRTINARSHGRPALSDDERRRIVERRADGESIESLAKSYARTTEGIRYLLRQTAGTTRLAKFNYGRQVARGRTSAAVLLAQSLAAQGHPAEAISARTGLSLSRVRRATYRVFRLTKMISE